MPLSKEDFELLADETILHRRGRQLRRRLRNRRFRAGLGVSSYVCSWYWNQLEKQKLLPKGFQPKHFLWTLLFLKLYSSESVHASICDCDETTFRKWVWIGLKVIGDLDLVSKYMCFCRCYIFLWYNIHVKILWENRQVRANGNVCRITLDGTDFRTGETYPFNKKWFSHKFKGPGLRYEVSICIQTGWIVWISGPFPPGPWPDIKIARNGLHAELAHGEKYLADGGYRDKKGGFSETPTGLNNSDQRMKARARARHENVNRLFKNFGVLERRYRHDKCKHGRVFHAVAHLVQAMIQLEGAVHQVQYKEWKSVDRIHNESRLVVST